MNEDVIASESDAMVVKPLVSLCDTLHLGLYVDSFKITDEDYLRLDEAKKRSQEKTVLDREEIIDFHGKFFRVTGARQHYRWVLINDDLTVKIAKAVSGAFPEIFIEYRSRLLMAGLRDAHAAVREWVGKWACIRSEKVSRADLALDIQGDLKIDLDHVVMRCRTNVEHGERFEVYREGRKITGYTFGAGALMLRIYDKTVEIGKSHKEYMHAEWEKQGWDGISKVWRVEGQLRREVLKEFHIEAVRDLIEKSADIWRYLTGEWFTVRTPSVNDQTRSRWSLSDVWKIIHGSFKEFGELTGVVRERIKDTKIAHIVPQLLGLLTTWAALSEKGVFDFEAFGSVINTYCAGKGKTLRAIVADKMRRFALFEETVCQG